MKVIIGATLYPLSTSKKTSDDRREWDYASTPSSQREKGDAEQRNIQQQVPGRARATGRRLGWDRSIPPVFARRPACGHWG